MEWENNLIGHKAGEKYGEIGVVRYADSCYTNNIKNKKSVTRYYFFLSRDFIT